MQRKFDDLEARLRETHDLFATRSVLIWDQMTYMPAGGRGSRARQLAALRQLAHEQLSAPEIGRLLDRLVPWAETLPRESREASVIRVARREHDRATRVPGSLMRAFQLHAAESYQAWEAARSHGDFAAVLPYLRRTLDFSRRIAACHAGYEHLADPLIEVYDGGMTTSTLRALFAELREGLVPIARSIAAHPVADDSCLRRRYPRDRQLAFGRELIEALGFDFARGRLDLSAHPCTTNLSLNDVRITTRVDEDYLPTTLFGTLHEAGHALYEQGIDPSYDGTFLAHATSLGVHESQARLLENLVGRSLPFWECWYGRLVDAFPEQLRSVPLETFYRAVNKVEGSLVRVQADEVSYNLHVILRFDFEVALLEGSLALEDLPEAWRARHVEDFGVSPVDDREGVMQDVHWFRGVIGGAFQGYALGDLLAAQFYERALTEVPSLSADLRQGRFDGLLAWMRRRIHRHGDSLPALELIEQVTGGGIRVAPFLGYLRTKYGELFPD